MKKIFNIKKIGLIIFTVVGMLSLIDIVDAKNVCYYRDNYFYNMLSCPIENEEDDMCYSDSDNYMNHAKDIYYQLTYDNGTVTVKFYDAKDKTLSNDTYSKLGGQYYSVLENATEFANLKDSDFENGCPILTKVVSNDNWNIAVGKFSEDNQYYKLFDELDLKDAYSDPYLQNNNSTCKEEISGNETTGYFNYLAYAARYCGYLIPTDPPGVNSQIEGENILTCSYVHGNTYDTDSDINKYNARLYINHSKKTVSMQCSYNLTNNVTTVNFTYEDTKGKCPKVIYSNNDNTNFSIIKTKEFYDPWGTVEKFSINNSGTTENGKSGCQFLYNANNELNSFGKIVKSMYSLIRYLVPVLIIVFSIIDFLGVIFSGENDKMEKTKKRFVIRMIAGILILFIPAILELILKLSKIIGNGENLIDAVCQLI